MMMIRTKLSKNVAAVAVWPFILIPAGEQVSETALRHERIHHAQQKELLLLPFFVWYGIEYLVRLCRCRNRDRAYRRTGFEAEAYLYENCPGYLKTRKHYSFLKFLK
jgi:hypothetical protein